MIPPVNEMGKELEKLGYVAFGRHAYNQTLDNCFEIASYLSNKFGYICPKSRADLRDRIDDVKSIILFGRGNMVSRVETLAYLIIRSPDDGDSFVTHNHVAFEYHGKEYNYGPGSKGGFTIDCRVPLYQKQR
jgi:hypothetical protein